jgi:hypothetical protein
MTDTQLTVQDATTSTLTVPAPDALDQAYALLAETPKGPEARKIVSWVRDQGGDMTTACALLGKLGPGFHVACVPVVVAD